MVVFHDRLKQLRLEKRITQKELAGQLQLSPQRYNYYEQGIRQPQFDILLSIADYFGVSLDYLMGRTACRGEKPEKKRIRMVVYYW